MSGCYIDIYRFVWMLIGSEITYDDAFFILYEVRVIGNHADGDMVLLKKSCHEITLLRYPSTKGCPARHLMLPCQSLGAHYEMQINPLFTLSREIRSPRRGPQKSPH